MFKLGMSVAMQDFLVAIWTNLNLLLNNRLCRKANHE